MQDFRLLSLLLFLLSWEAAEEGVAFSACWQKTESFWHGWCSTGFFFSVTLLLRRCFKEDFLLSPDKHSCGAKPSWIKKNMPAKSALLSDVCWAVLLEQHVQELFSGCSECPALFANPESSRRHSGINRCYVELRLKIPVKEWMCWTTSTKISLYT